MTELIKPSCCDPLLILSKRGLKAIHDGGKTIDFPLPKGSPYSSDYAKYLWHLLDRGFNMEVEYRGFTIPLFQYVPCGTCELCKQSRRIDIIRRAELASSEFTCPPYQFKLTYDDEHLPKYSELQYRHVQLFFKRLRKKLASLHLPTDFKYIVAGEYGSKNTHRPHYHVIFFNNPFRCSEFEPFKEKTLKRLVWEAWQNDKWFVFNTRENFTQCFGSIATYVTKYIGKSSLQESVFIPEVGRCKHPCFVRCSSKLGRGVMMPSKDEYRNGLSNEFEYFSLVTGQVRKHYMSRTELRYLHPSPLGMVPAKVNDAYYSLVYSLSQAVKFGLMEKVDAVNLADLVRLNVQHPRLIEFYEGSVLRPSSLISSKIVQAIKDDCEILTEFGDIPQSLIDHYLKFKDKIQHDGSEIAAKLFKIRKDDAEILARSID